MKHYCPKCGHEEELNPGTMLAKIETPKRLAWRKKAAERFRAMHAGVGLAGAVGKVRERPTPENKREVLSRLMEEIRAQRKEAGK